MRKLIAFRGGHRAPMAAVEECIAHLHEELNLTTAFTGAMVRMGNYRAALGVVEEQRVRVRQVPVHFDRAFARPRRKAKAAIAGLAAAALLGSGALAAWVTPNRSEAAREKRVKIQKAVEMLEAARLAETTPQANGYVAAATSVFQALDPKINEKDPLTPKELGEAFALLKKKVGDKYLNMAIAAARRAGLRVPDVPPPPPAPEPEKPAEPNPSVPSH